MKNKISILGSLNMDIILGVEHHPNLGETILARGVKKALGGKGANQAVAAARLGSNINMIGKLGNDEYGKIIRESLIKDNINTEFLFIDNQKPTGTAYIMVDKEGNNSIIVDSGANMSITWEELKSVQNILGKSKIIISQFETPVEITIKAFKKSRELGVFTILNPAPAVRIPEDLLLYTDIIIPNETEAERLTGIKIDNVMKGFEAGTKFLNAGCRYAIITLGDKGALVVSESGQKLIPAHKVIPVDTTAAGDAFIGAFATKLLNYDELNLEGILKAAEFGNLVSSIVVQRYGAQSSLPYLSELTDYIV